MEILNYSKLKKQNKNQSNNRYKHFPHTIFTAGDEEQFKLNKDEGNYNLEIPNINLSKNVYLNKKFYIWYKYKNVKETAVINTFRYMFYKFKKGIFVKIVNNKLKVFLPFSNANYSNEWSHKIKVNPSKYTTMKEFIKKIYKDSGYSCKNIKLNENINEWYGNNCLLRYEYPIKENDTNILILKDMIEELCDKREIPDIEFFINRRDFPLLTRDNTEPYNNIWGTSNKSLVSHNYEQYTPILSFSCTKRYADLMIPTWDDWSRVQRDENKWFNDTRNQDYTINNSNKEWDKKKPTAVFRGSTTGKGVTINTNPRLKVAYLSKITPLDENGIPYLDAGITKWNNRPRKLENQKYLSTIEIKKLPFGLVSKLSITEQSTYKYIINIDGHVSAFRLSLELSTGSVILLVDSEWKLWYSELLVPYEHYIPIKNDLSDLIEKIKWCRNNDDKCKKIASNTLIFFERYLKKNSILDYLQKLLVNIKNEIGVYTYNNILIKDKIINLEYSQLDYSYPKLNKDISNVNTIRPFKKRSYSVYKGIELTVRKIIKEGNFEDIAKYQSIVFKNKLSVIKYFKLANFDFIVKSTSDSNKIKENIHESFVGTKQINNLIKFIPNFTYIFGLYKTNNNNTYNIITEKINGISLHEYLSSTEFNLNEFLFILIQICLAIQVAQKKCGLVHYDLTPWNIILKRYDKIQCIDYLFSIDKIVRVKTKLIPIIIDYGKSHVIHEQIHHGFIHICKVSTSHDFLFILLTSLKCIINNQHLNYTDLNDIFNLANFVSNTTYRPLKFKNVKDIRHFLKRSCKYSSFLYNDKYQLEKLQPFDLVNYILVKMKKNKIFKDSIEYKNNNIYNINNNNGDYIQIFEYIFSNNTKDYTKIYLKFCSRINKCIDYVQTITNIFFIYHMSQYLEGTINIAYRHMIQLFTYNNIETSKYIYIFNYLLNKLNHVFNKNILKYNTNKKIFYDIITISNTKLIQSPYSEDTFVNKTKVLELINSINNTITDITEYKEIIEMVVLNNKSFQLNKENRIYYMKYFKDIFELNSLIIKNNIANDKTLLMLNECI